MHYKSAARGEGEDTFLNGLQDSLLIDIPFEWHKPIEVVLFIDSRLC